MLCCVCVWCFFLFRICLFSCSGCKSAYGCCVFSLFVLSCVFVVNYDASFTHIHMHMHTHTHTRCPKHIPLYMQYTSPPLCVVCRTKDIAM
ncbi:hypothetical protein EON63_11610 [archaeon]|nr:MAG: hypothetical protein EON63_11610 [archaeon]